MNSPALFNCAGFQQAWVGVSKHLANNQWEAYGVVVHIRDVTMFDRATHGVVERFAGRVRALGPKHVAYTIFPHGLYAQRRSATALFDAYNRPGGLYDFTRTRPKRGWGTYFRRMTHYETTDGTQNQLDNIIRAVRSRQTLSRAAYTVVIQHPGGETTRKMGGPCLNFLTVQIDPGPPASLGLMSIYRNHDFLERAYGNYWGLCNLVQFMARETGMIAGPLTCVSSHAYVPSHKSELDQFVRAL